VTTHTIPTDTPPDVAVALAGLMQQVEELCAALSDIHNTACVGLVHGELNDVQRDLWARVRRVADEAVGQVRRQQQQQQGEAR
jgi:hypothetical protein